MLLCSIQDTARFDLNWTRVKPRITQKFGLRPDVYKQFGMKGHNGLDYGVPVGTPVFSPIDGIVKVKKDKGGYGWHVKIRNKTKAIECVLGHMSKILVADGAIVSVGDKVALSGNTGFSSGPHVHEGFRRLIPATGDVFKWQVADYDNGYKGYFDHIEFVICWKGGFLKNTL